jgi:hypothetical protein
MHVRLGQQAQAASAVQLPLSLPGLPVLTSLLQSPMHELGPLGPWQEAAGLASWPESFVDLDQFISWTS